MEGLAISCMSQKTQFYKNIISEYICRFRAVLIKRLQCFMEIGRLSLNL